MHFEVAEAGRIKVCDFFCEACDFEGAVFYKGDPEVVYLDNVSSYLGVQHLENRLQCSGHLAVEFKLKIWMNGDPD